MWKVVLPAILSLCLGVSPALAQSARLPQLRNESSTKYQFVVLCARSSGTITVDPGQTVFFDPGLAGGGCQIGNKTLQGTAAKPIISGTFTSNSLCRITPSEDLVCADALLNITVQVTRADKPVFLLLDGAPFNPGAISATMGFNRIVQTGAHTLTVIGTGKGTFDILATWVSPNMTMTSVPLIKGASPAPMGGDTWMVTKTIQVEPLVR